jgi:hypothetical protein
MVSTKRVSCPAEWDLVLREEQASVLVIVASTIDKEGKPKETVLHTLRRKLLSA